MCYGVAGMFGRIPSASSGSGAAVTSTAFTLFEKLRERGATGLKSESDSVERSNNFTPLNWYYLTSGKVAFFRRSKCTIFVFFCDSPLISYVISENLFVSL